LGTSTSKRTCKEVDHVDQVKTVIEAEAGELVIGRLRTTVARVKIVEEA
jgi:hypothetical protein